MIDSVPLFGFLLCKTKEFVRNGLNTGVILIALLFKFLKQDANGK